MKRRTFLQILGLTAAPISPLVGADLGQALTAAGKADEALLRVRTSKGPLHFEIPVVWVNNPEGGTACHPIKKALKMVSGVGDMRVEGMEVMTHPKLAKFYKSVGLERGWVPLQITPVDIPAMSFVTMDFSERGLYSIC